MVGMRKTERYCEDDEEERKIKGAILKGTSVRKKRR